MIQTLQNKHVHFLPWYSMSGSI